MRKFSPLGYAVAGEGRGRGAARYLVAVNLPDRFILSVARIPLCPLTFIGVYECFTMPREVLIVRASP